MLDREIQELGGGVWRERNKMCLQIKWLKKESGI